MPLISAVVTPWGPARSRGHDLCRQIGGSVAGLGRELGRVQRVHPLLSTPSGPAIPQGLEPYRPTYTCRATAIGPRPVGRYQQDHPLRGTHPATREPSKGFNLIPGLARFATAILAIAPHAAVGVRIRGMPTGPALPVQGRVL